MARALHQYNDLGALVGTEDADPIGWGDAHYTPPVDLVEEADIVSIAFNCKLTAAADFLLTLA